MHDFAVALAFLSMVMAPCLVAMSTGAHRVKEAEEAPVEDLMKRPRQDL